MSVFRMEISFASFLRLIRRETERSSPVRRLRKGETERAQQGRGWCRGRARAAGWKGNAVDRGEGEGGRESCRGAARTGRRSVVVRITAKRHRPIFLPPGPHEASTCFPSAARISDLQFAHCGSLTRLSSASCPWRGCSMTRDRGMTAKRFPNSLRNVAYAQKREQMNFWYRINE